MNRVHTIGIDCRFASHVGGLGTYTRELVRALVSLEDSRSHRIVLFVREKNDPWCVDMQHFPHVTLVPCDVPHYSVKEQLFLPFLAYQYHLSTLFVPHFAIPLLCPCPVVMTVHDLILHSFPGNASIMKRFLYRVLMRLATLRARTIVTVTETVQSMLINTYALTSDVVQCIYPGVRNMTTDPIRSVHDILPVAVRQYFLYIGNAKEHKNVPFLLEAFARLKRNDVDLVLVMSARDAATLTLPERTHVLSMIEDDDVVILMRHAKAFVTASRMEGFCLPVIEAMMHGTRVIVPNVPPFPEVSGGHALLYPLSVEGLHNALFTILHESEDDRTQKLFNATIYAQQFSWNKSATSLFPLLLP